MPRIRFRVVWGFGETMASFWPSRRLNSVDLPTLGRPIRLANPARCSGADVEGVGWSLIELPEQVYLARVHQAGLERRAVVVADEVQASVATEEVELFPEGVPQRPGLAPRRLDRDDRLANDGGGPREGEREDIRPASHPAVAGVQDPDRPIVDQRQAQLVVPHPQGPERGAERAANATEIDGQGLPVRDDDHVSRRRLHSS